MRNLRNQSGITLIEIIVAIALIGIIATAMLSMSTFGLTNLMHSGQKTEEVMELQTIIDDLNGHLFTSPVTQAKIESYLTGKSYPNATFSVSLVNSASVPTAYNVYSVTITKKTPNGKRSASSSTFVLDRGSRYAP